MDQHKESINTQHFREAGINSIRDKKRSILLVEDYEPSIVMMTMFFEQLGYECDAVKNGVDAFNMFCMSKYDLIIMDLQLPDIDGLEATRRIRLWEKEKTLEPTPIIAASANSTDEDKMFCLKAGMNDCLAKPFQLDELEEILEQWIPRIRN